VEDILTAIAKIEEYTAAAGGLERLLSVEDAYHDAVERRLAIISEAAVKLSGLASTMEPQIPWRDIRGLGNILRHGYDDLADGVLRLILTKHLKPLKMACLRMRTKLTEA
jgi:uncharacterized protein with HEPN domain